MSTEKELRKILKVVPKFEVVFGEHYKTQVLDQILDAVRKSVEVGYTPNYLLLGPVFSRCVSEDIVKISGMKLWRAVLPLPEGKSVIALQLSTVKEGGPSSHLTIELEETKGPICMCSPHHHEEIKMVEIAPQTWECPGCGGKIIYKAKEVED